ncbi:hypothetical protein ACHAXA_001200 [Cyclostephanos tholiformis]|uniref:propionyl-CoA carboxylase n=1 Tax=Cyclostephanos tholiformis TaxID=382380 RepID=A0ABD3SQ66_9STRA
MFGDAYPVRPSAGLSSLSTVPDGGNVVKASVTKLPKRRVSREADKENDEGLGEDVVDVPHCVEISSLEYHPSKVFAHLKIAGDSRVLQVHGEDEIGTLKLTMYGADADVLIMSPAEYQLACHMLEPAPLDLGDFVLSPMPGTLVSFAVEEGDVVEMGQELCVVEAMKMQNIIRSRRAGPTVGKLHGKVGASLRADEIFLEFDKSGEHRLRAM